MKKPTITAHKTRRGRIVLGCIALVLAYIIASLAIDSGRLTQYFLTVLLVALGVRWLIMGFKKA